MKRLCGIIPAVFFLLLVTLSLFAPLPVNAADVRTGNDIILSSNQKNLKDLYLFGSMIQLNAPVTNDVVASGGTINITGNITNDLIAAGGTVTVQGKVGNTVRVAGGNVTIDGPVTNDLVAAGGNVTVSKTATIGGDLLVAGGQVDIEAPVHGKILMSGGNVTLNSTVGGTVIGGEIGNLTLGPQAKINGDLTYSSKNPAHQDTGSTVQGEITYHQIKKQQETGQIVAQAAVTSAFYKLIIAVILSILFIYFFRGGILTTFALMEKAPWKSGGIGFGYIVLAPLASIILLILAWLGIASFLLYALIFIISVFFTNVFVGWWILRWWYHRKKIAYLLDWKAGIVGPIVLFIVLLIPFLGWLAAALIFFVATGAFVQGLTSLVPQLQITAKKK